MSFLSRLFRGNGHRTEDQPLPAANNPAPIATDALPLTEASQPQPGDTITTDEPTTSPAQAEDAQPSQAEKPWWEESSTTEAEPALVEESLFPLSETAAPHTETPAQLEALPAPDTAETSHASAAEDDGTRQLTDDDIPALVALRSRHGLAVAAQRDIGRVRSVNQDSIFAFITTLPRESSDITLGLFVVADGMGGHDGGEIASRIAVTTVGKMVLSELVMPALNDNVTEALQPLIISAVQEANHAIWSHAQSIGSDMGTTCTVALLLGQALYIGHVGDSRAYLRVPTGLRQLTNDHSAVGRLIQVGQLDPAEAREHPLRSQLYRTVGQSPEIQVDFIYQPIGDASHLLLCSDGLWGMLDEDVILDAIEHSIWPHDACHELIARANLAGGDDNISGIVVTLPAQSNM